MGKKVKIILKNIKTQEKFVPLSYRKSPKMLWHELKQGNKQAVNQLFDTYADKLFAYGMRITNDPILVQEAIQSLFIYIYQKRATISEPNSPLAYLCISLKRLIRRMVQQQKRQKLDPIDSNYDFELEIDAEAAIIHTELSQEKIKNLQQVINDLSPRQREVIYLKYYNNLAGEDIATIMGITHQSVRNLLFEALKILKNKLLDNSIILSLFTVSSWNQ